MDIRYLQEVLGCDSITTAGRYLCVSLAHAPVSTLDNLDVYWRIFRRAVTTRHSVARSAGFA